MRSDEDNFSPFQNTSSVWAQIGILAALLIIFWGIDETLIPREYFRLPIRIEAVSPQSLPWYLPSLNLVRLALFGTGLWIPGLASLLVAAMVAKIRPLYWVLSLVLYYFASIAYFFASDLHLTVTDSLGGAIEPFFWGMAWFYGNAIGLAIKFVRKKWLTNLQ